MQPSEGNSPAGDHRGKVKLGHGKNVTEQRALTLWKSQMDRLEHRKNATRQWTLTLWRSQREDQVGTQKESNLTRGTHFLKTTEGGSSQDMKRTQPSKGHLHPRDHRGRDKSGHRKNVNKQGALTFWKP